MSFLPLEQILLPPNVPAGINLLLLAHLAYTLRSTNTNTPPITIQAEGNYWRIVDGRHRYLAHIIAGRQHIHCHPHTGGDPCQPTDNGPTQTHAGLPPDATSSPETATPAAPQAHNTAAPSTQTTSSNGPSDQTSRSTPTTYEPSADSTTTAKPTDENETHADGEPRFF